MPLHSRTQALGGLELCPSCSLLSFLSLDSLFCPEVTREQSLALSRNSNASRDSACDSMIPSCVRNDHVNLKVRHRPQDTEDWSEQHRGWGDTTGPLRGGRRGSSEPSDRHGKLRWTQFSHMFTGMCKRFGRDGVFQTHTRGPLCADRKRNSLEDIPAPLGAGSQHGRQRT